MSEQLQAFGFVAPSQQAVPIATALLSSAAGGGRRLRAVAALGVALVVSLVLDATGVEPAMEAAEASLLSGLADGATVGNCTLGAETLGGMVRMGVSSMVAVAPVPVSLLASSSVSGTSPKFEVNSMAQL